MASHDTEEHACNECGKKYKNKRSMKNHAKTHNNPEDTRCSICQLVCSRKDKLDKHLQTKHNVKLKVKVGKAFIQFEPSGFVKEIDKKADKKRLQCVTIVERHIQ